ncbi:hypothetical protein [Sagittula salina]|uniref:Uncharacterized protein n=1 Tax=Sagittula salina TaxID=2820268 RepID=A0A940MRK5_9RHOB|nr:hypothetical protein [Sagittula salina]MBP0484648.1 hypothetical protein [Sagittula salina]
MSKTKKVPITILDREIETYVPARGDGDAIAIISGFGWVFKAPTPMAAMKKADTFRREQWNNICSPERRVPMTGPLPRRAEARA